MEARDMLREQLCEARRQGVTFESIGKAVGLSRTAVSQYANKGLLPTSAEKIRALQDYMASMRQDNSPMEMQIPMIHYKNEVGIFKTGEYRDAIGWLESVFHKRKVGVLYGHPGSGKTTVIREYAKMRESVRLITCWPTMLVGDLIDEIAQAVGITVTGRRHKRAMQVVEYLRGRQDIMLVFDETENLRGRDVKCVEVLRMIWDAVQTPIVFCGTYQLVEMLTRGSGWQNLAQLYRRNWACNLKGISEPEVRDILRNYNITPDATNMLVKVALDVKHGGMGNFVELLDISLEAAAGGAVDSGIVQGAKQFKLLY